MRLDHLQIAIPPDSETQARAFYGEVLGLKEIAKPAALAARGGLWFLLSDGVGLHLGIDHDFRAARKAHPGLILDDLDALRKRLSDLGLAVTDDIEPFGRERIYVDDPFGNRIEVIRNDARQAQQ